MQATVTKKRGRKKQVQTHDDAVVNIVVKKKCKNCGGDIPSRRVSFCSAICRHEYTKDRQLGVPATKYKPEFCTTKLDEYLDMCKGKSNPTMIPTTSSFIVRENVELPEKEGYAYFIGVTAPTLRNWEREYEEFARAMDRLMYEQKKILQNGGLAGNMQQHIVRLLLAVNHGVKEETEVKHKHQFVGIVKHLYGRTDEIEREILEGAEYKALPNGDEIED